MPVLKRLERYFSALFKLGRISRMAKAASQATGVMEPRLDAVGQDLADLADRQARLDGVPDHVAGISAEIADLRARLSGLEARIGEEVVAGLRGEIDGLSARLGEVADTATGLTVRGDGQEARLATAEARLATAEERVAEAGAHADAVNDRADAISRRVDGEAEARAALEDRLSGHQDHFRRLEEAHRAHAADAHDRMTRLESAVGDGLEPRMTAAETRAAEADRRLDRAIGDTAQSGRAYAELSRRLDLMRFRGVPEGAPEMPEPAHREGLEALLDAFYGRLEDRFRGSREEIKRRLAVYLPDIEAATAAAPGRPVLDLGCGRGEWVELLSETGIAAQGVDLNPIQIAEAQRLGLDVREGDALRALADAPDGAFAAVTAHHLVEHLPFDTVTWMTREALRVLAPGGVLIYETPNARNLIVGATTFNIDPTHRRPMMAEVLTTLMDTIGYHPVEARPLHPSETREAFVRDGRVDPHIAELLFGPQDLAVLGSKPAIGA